MIEQSIDIFVQLVQDHRFWGYTILFVAMVLEGEIFLVVAGMLAALDAFDIGDILWISISGVVLGNAMWYSLGSALENRAFAKGMIRWAEKVITFFLPKFREKPFKSIFFSKFIYGVNRATVIMSGVLHIPFKLFFKAELLASIVWVTLYSSIGYFFGYTAISITRKTSHFILLAVAFVVGFILIEKLISYRYGHSEREKNKENNNTRR